MDKLGINLGYLIVQILNFAIIMVVIRAWVIKPVLAVLEKRRLTIAQGLEDAHVAAEARSNAEREADKIITEAKNRASEIIKESALRAEEVSKEIKENIEAEITQEREIAKDEIEHERNLILRDIRTQVADLSIAAARKLIGFSLIDDRKKQETLINEFFSGVRSGQVDVLQGVKVSGTTAEVISALPLTEKEEAKIKNALSESTSKDMAVKFRVDPDILGGLILKVDNQVIDGSVLHQLQTMHTSLY